MQPESQVYFLLAPTVGVVKIGCSIDIVRRLGEIRLISPVILELIGTVPGGFNVEAAYHKRWAQLRQHGEWFTATDELLQHLWADSLTSLWDAALPAARRLFVETADMTDEQRSRLSRQLAAPVFDRTLAGAA